MGGGHHHGGGGGWRGGWGPAWGPYGYPVQFAPSEVFVVDSGASSSDDDQKARAMAYVMSLPKAQRAAAYVKIFGKPAPAGALGDWPPYQYQNTGGLALDWRMTNGSFPAPWTQPYEYRGAETRGLSGMGGIFEKKTLNLPEPGKPEIVPAGSPLGDCGCGCKGAGTCGKGVGDYAVDFASLAKPAAIAVGAYLLYRHFKKKR